MVLKKLIVIVVVVSIRCLLLVRLKVVRIGVVIDDVVMVID